MAMFSAIDAAQSGLGLYRTWMDAISDNIANANTVRPTSQNAFQARYVVAQAVGNGVEGGVAVGGIALGNPQGDLVYEPTNPLADKNGMVRYPDIDMGSQMTQLILAQRGYQANLATVDRARQAYESALQIGKPQ